MIAVEGVTWTYPHAAAPSLRGLDLRVRPGEFVVLCGASGSGKSTALRLLNGLVPHFHDEGVLTGTVTVAGLPTAATDLDDLGRATGSVLQHPRRQFFTATVAEEVAFGLENSGVAPERIRSLVAAELGTLAAGLPVDRRLDRLSGGQQQQVAISAATVHRPPVVLLDEPSSNLSADAVDRLAATLAGLKAVGATVVVAEHRLRYLADLADRVVVMRDGAVHAEWSATAFRGVTDEELAREGLRGRVRAASLPALPAAGAGVVGAVPAGRVPGGDLELEDVRCRRGGRTVLAVDRAGFAAGTVTAVRGVNGAGKSTLGRVVTGLQRASGTVRLDGRVLGPGARQRAGAVVMQDVTRQLFTESVAAEIALAGGGRMPPERLAEVLAELDLAHLADRHPLSLSGGQQQRLVVATVRLSGRRVVVFDEPSSGVDRRHLRSIADQVRAVAAGGAVVLLVSHDDDLLSLAADRQLVLAPPG